MVKLHEPEPKDDTKCVQLAAECPPVKKIARFVTEVGVSPLDTNVVLSKKKQPDERIRYNRDTLISIESSAYASTTPKCIVDAIESGDKKRWWLRPNEIVVNDNKRKLHLEIRPLLQTNTVLPPSRPKTSDDVIPLQSPTIDNTLQNRQQEDGDQPPIIEKNDGNSNKFNSASDRERRIGSGRIPTNINQRDFRPSGGLMGLRDRESISPASVFAHHNMNQSLPMPHRGRDRSDFWSDRFDARSVNRDFESDRGGAYNRNANQKGRFMSNNMHSTGDGRHVYNENRGQSGEDPEWFSCGPISRHDTIELRGFDDPEPDENPASILAKHPMNAALKPSSHQTPRSVTFADDEDDANITQTTNNSNCPSPPPAMSTPTKTAFGRNAVDPRGNGGQHLGYEDIFKTSEIKSGTAGEQARFGGWLKKNTTTLEDKRQCKTAESYAASRTMPENYANSNNSNAFLDLLRRGNLPTQINNELLMLQKLQRQQLPISAQVYSVDDLEERMRAGNVRSNPGSSRIQSVEELEAQFRARNEQSGISARSTPNPSDSSALKNLFMQMRGVGAQQMHKPFSHQNVQLNQQLQQSAVGLMQILSANIQQRQAAGSMPTYEQLRTSNLMNHMTPHQQFLYQQKIQHQQQMHQHQQQKMDLMNMPPHEQQALYQYLSQGEVTQESLTKKLSNPALAPSERHLILSALNLARTRVRFPQHAKTTAQDQKNGAAPMSPSTVEANAYATVGVERQSAPNSPIIGVAPRMPSPRELKVHTESIMKGALFKKKMEERELLKRQEWHLQHQHKTSGLGEGTSRNDVEMHRSLSMDLHQSPAPMSGRKVPPEKFSFLPTPMMRENVVENNIAGAAATAVENLNNHGNRSWPAHNDSSKPPDTQKVQDIASTANPHGMNMNPFIGEKVGPSNQIRLSDSPTFGQQITERQMNPTQNNFNDNMATDLSRPQLSLSNDKNTYHKP